MLTFIDLLSCSEKQLLRLWRRANDGFFRCSGSSVHRWDWVTLRLVYPTWYVTFKAIAAALRFKQS